VNKPIMRNISMFSSYNCPEIKDVLEFESESKCCQNPMIFYKSRFSELSPSDSDLPFIT